MVNRNMKWLALLALVTTATPGSGAAAADRICGVGAPCKIETGEYHLAFPDDWDGTTPLPSVMFFHGHGSTGENVIKGKGLRSAFGDGGYLLIAPTGAGWPGHKATGWPARLNSKGRRNDIGFASRVLDDVAKRVPLDRRRVLVSGFSSGASLAWHIGCHGNERFSGFAAVAGGLRRPTPAQRCPGGPFRVIHFHGFADGQVPLEGRGIREWHQGDVFESLALLRATNECRSNPTRFESSGIFQCRIWEDCASGNDIQFCLHAGGHKLPRGWSSRALSWFERSGGGS